MMLDRLIAAARPITVLIGLLLLTGCTSVIHKKLDIEGGQSVLVDARQRAIMNRTATWDQDRGGIKPNRVVCAEPSPDVATAVASAVGAGVSVLNYGSASVSQAFGEALAQLGERASTVQLLRDVLYRACEAYANGAISNTTYAMITARMGQTMTTLMLGELAAGAFGRNLAGANASADSSAVASLVQQLKDSAAKDLAAAQAANPPAAEGSAPPRDPSKTDTSSSAKVTTAVLTAIGAISGRPANSQEIAHEVGRIHKNFLDDDNLDALLVACVTALSTEKSANQKNGTETGLAELCRKSIFEDFGNRVPNFLAAKARAEVAIVRANTERVYAQAVANCFDAQAKAPDAKTSEAAQKSCADLVKVLSGHAAILNAAMQATPTVMPAATPVRNP